MHFYILARLFLLCLFVFPEIEVIYLCFEFLSCICGLSSFILSAASWSAENAFVFFLPEVQCTLRNGFQRRWCKSITKAFARTSNKDTAAMKVALLE